MGIWRKKQHNLYPSDLRSVPYKAHNGAYGGLTRTTTLVRTDTCSSIVKRISTNHYLVPEIQLLGTRRPKKGV
jgi:hypothetical protein